MPWTTKFTTAADTKTDSVAVPALVDAPKNQGQTIVIQPDTSTHWNRTKLALGIIFGGVGLAGVGTAIGLGLNASALNQKSQDATSAANNCQIKGSGTVGTCNDSSTPPQPLTGQAATDAATGHSNYAIQAHSAAATSQTIAIVSGIVGGLSLIAGVFFIVTAPESKNAAPPPQVGTLDKPVVSNVQVIPLVGPYMNGLGISGSF